MLEQTESLFKELKVLNFEKQKFFVFMYFRVSQKTHKNKTIKNMYPFGY